MGKSSLIGVSLVAAIPGGFLAYTLVMAFLNYADKMPTMLMALAGVALLCSVTVALSPIGIAIFSPNLPQTDGDSSDEPKGRSNDDDEDADDDDDDDDDDDELEGFADEDDEDSGLEIEDSGDDDDDDDDEFSLEDDADDEFDIEFDDDEDER